MDQLRPFAGTPAVPAFQVFGTLEFQSQSVEIRYRVLGPMAELSLPMPVAHPHFRDELWATTCLEIFLQEPGQAAYAEWNFSPSGNWAYYHFQNYRQPSPASPRLQPLAPLQWIRDDDQLHLQVRIPLDPTMSLDKRSWRYGLTAILHLKSGEKQYWALDHAGDKPDFHLAASFRGEGRPA